MTFKVTNTIPLPLKLRKSWKGSSVIIVPTENALLVKRVETISPLIREKLKRAAKNISSKEIASAIRTARAA